MATWTAVFLALPSCPCELFESLGMDFPHKHEAGKASEGNPNHNGVTELKAPSEGSEQELPVCHCEEGLGKTAEACSEFELDTPNQDALTIDQHDSNDFLILSSKRKPARAPPPEMLTNYWLNSARTGVYQL